MKRLTVPLLIATLAVAGCGGRYSDSGWNPLGWFGSDRGPTSLEPEGGYATTNTDARPGIPAITGAHWEVLNEGRLLVVTGLGATKGYWDAELITEAPSPSGRLTPDPDGVLRLRFVAWPPPADSDAARMPARPETDTISVALTLSSNVLAGVQQVQISGATNTITIRR
ncbi:hypothetical protein FNJ84_13350 [Paracoccus sp. M683]|uniref:hypothetical protein n=1 Tax=Paracoccus sp. M683 TaxID=2594268 RepID=UPI00117C21E5|nr:hypothetical protein [Paracoccus sp. M683]TRW96267.1 hypothetical protein FNJ84_13350 [Paracoccus sp. M683]